MNETDLVPISLCVVGTMGSENLPKGQDRDGSGVFYRAFCTKAWRDGSEEEGPWRTASNLIWTEYEEPSDKE